MVRAARRGRGRVVAEDIEFSGHVCYEPGVREAVER